MRVSSASMHGYVKSNISEGVRKNVSKFLCSVKKIGLQPSHFRKKNYDNIKPLRYISTFTAKEFLKKKLTELAVSDKARQDPVYSRQASEAVLASVYSHHKDMVCRNLKGDGNLMKSYLQVIGEVARKACLPGDVKDGVFTPSGTGANPFINAILSPLQKANATLLNDEEQGSILKNYAEKIIYEELSDVCKKNGFVTPRAFSRSLSNASMKINVN